MKEYLRDAGQVMTEQKTSTEGLSSSEASERLQKHGLNKLAEGKKESLIFKFFKSLFNHWKKFYAISNLARRMFQVGKFK